MGKIKKDLKLYKDTANEAFDAYNAYIEATTRLHNAALNCHKVPLDVTIVHLKNKKKYRLRHMLGIELAEIGTEILDQAHRKRPETHVVLNMVGNFRKMIKNAE